MDSFQTAETSFLQFWRLQVQDQGWFLLGTRREGPVPDFLSEQGQSVEGIA